MNRTLAIITLDFFVMTSIAFFVLQFIQPNDNSTSQLSSSSAIFRIEVGKSQFLKLLNANHSAPEQVNSVPLQDLIELGMVAHPRGQVLNDIPLIYSADDDGYTLIVQAAPDYAFDLVIYIKQIKSLAFALAKPVVTLAGGGLVAVQTDAVLDLSTGPLVVFHIGNG